MLGDGGSSHSRPGSISNKMNLEIDIPDDKRADKNPDFKTPLVSETVALEQHVPENIIDAAAQ